MYVEEKNSVVKKKNWICDLILKHHNFSESLLEAKRRFKNLLFRVNVSLWEAKGRL